MNSESWKINPLTGDYVMEYGSPVSTDSLQEPCYYRLKVKRKKWLYAPNDDYGSNLYLIKKNSTQNYPTQVENTIGQALQPILDDGRALAMDIYADQLQRFGVGMQIKVVSASGLTEQLVFKGIGV